MRQKFKEVLKVLHLTTELTPLAKAGGLGDVVGYLPKALVKEFPIDIRIMMLNYGNIDKKKYSAEVIIRDLKVKMPDNKNWMKISVWKSFLPESDIPIYLIDIPNFLNNEDKKVHLNNIIWSYQDIPYFICLCLSKVSLELLKVIDWYPDVIHYHDGFEAMVSKWLKTIYQNSNFYKKIATVVTIHNLATQPKNKISSAKNLGLKRSDFKTTIKTLGKKEINFTAEAIVNADMVNTVSPTYAREVLTRKYGAGLNQLLVDNKWKFTGIVNGVDYQDFDPRTNEDTPVKYWINSLDKKVENKLLLQKKFGLTQSADLPLICAITRLNPQKGLDLIGDVLKELVNMGAQFVILGSGVEKIEKIFIKAEKRYPKSVEAETKFDANLAQTIYAGSDILLMPSRFEPCGLSQIIAMRFGTVPIVRKTGGLADTVRDGYTGFVFKNYEKKDFLHAISRAVETYYNQKGHWKNMMINCMKKDFSWKKSAKKYIWLYKKAIANHRRWLEEQGEQKNAEKS